MDAVVLAGGYATRLWPITKNRPKMFLPIGETTVIDRIFSELEAESRIESVYVSTNQRFEEAFRGHLAESSFTKPELSVEETSEETEKLGVVGALAQLISREGIDDDLLVIAGDNLISFGIDEFVDFFEAASGPALAAYDVGSMDRATQYGVVELVDDRVVEFEEKPDDPASSLVSIACYGFADADLDLFREYLDDDNNPDEPGWFIQWLVERTPVSAFTFDGAWFDIGTPESYLDAVAWHLDGQSKIHPSARVEGADIGSNVHIMRDASVTDATVTRSVIFPESEIRDCELRRCLIDQDTRIEGIDLAGAVIGAHTTLNSSR